MEQSVAIKSEPAPTAVEPNLEMLQKTLEALQEQIRFADTKAGFLATLNLLLFGVIAQESDKLMAVNTADHNVLYHMALFLLLVYAMSAVAAVFCVILAVIPRIRGNSGRSSRSHFAHVSADYGNDHERYTRDVINMTSLDWAGDLAWQIMQVSHIAHTKHRLVRRGTLWSALSMALWIASLIADLVVRAK